MGVVPGEGGGDSDSIATFHIFVVFIPVGIWKGGTGGCLGTPPMKQLSFWSSNLLSPET